VALTELIGQELGSQTIVIEQGPVRAFATAVKDELRGKGRMILHGEQEFDYTRPPQVGETLTGTGRIAEVYERETGSAVMEFYVREMDWRDAAGEPVVTERFTLIVRRKKDEG
jgi:hydroxyacyl-ACP dehydratase HTD2-like protein with hotdog domain